MHIKIDPLDQIIFNQTYNHYQTKIHFKFNSEFIFFN